MAHVVSWNEGACCITPYHGIIFIPKSPSIGVVVVNFEWGLYLPTSFVTETPSKFAMRSSAPPSSPSPSPSSVPISSSFFRSLSLMDEGAEERGRRRRRRHRHYGVTVADCGKQVANFVQVLTSS